MEIEGFRKYARLFGMSRDAVSILANYLQSPDWDCLERAFFGRESVPDEQVVLQTIYNKEPNRFWWYYSHFHEQLVDYDWWKHAVAAGNVQILRRLKPYDTRSLLKLAIKHKQLGVFKAFFTQVRPLRAAEWTMKCRGLPRFIAYIELVTP